MHGDEDEEDPFNEVPVDDLVLDLRRFEVGLPDGSRWALDDDLDQGLIPEDSVRDRSLATVAYALGLLSDYTGDGAPEGWFLEVDPPDRVHEIELHEGIALESHGTDRLHVTVSIGLPVGADDRFEGTVERLVEPMLAHSGAVGRRSLVSELFRHEVTVMVRFEEMGGRTVGDLIRLGDDVRALLLAVRSGQPHEDVALNLVLAGHGAVLVGQPESRWLDVKSQLWALGTPAGKAEAAKDVSAMANGKGGMIVIPARTVLVSGREVINAVRDIPLELIDVTQIRDVLNAWVFPPLPDLVTEVVPTTEGRALVVVAVGEHRADNWPHLVVGDPDSEFAVQSVSAWVRDGDRNRALTAAEIHALMRARPRA